MEQKMWLDCVLVVLVVDLSKEARLSLPPRARTSSSPSPPASQSTLSVPKSRPPLGQPGRSFLVKRPSSLFSSHRAPSDIVAWGERPCSLVASVCPCLVALVCPCSSGDSEHVPGLLKRQPSVERRIRSGRP